jgi:hypothetical protein
MEGRLGRGSGQEQPRETILYYEASKRGYPVMVNEEKDNVAANHEPGQALPEDAAERAASGSGYQGEEITDAEWEKTQKDKKLKVVRKNSKDSSRRNSQKSFKR